MADTAAQRSHGRVKPLVAIVGRPNVGKSTLFNRVAGARTAVESDVSGTTRDRVTTDAEWAGRSFMLVDTGGLDLAASGDLSDEVREQVRVAIDDADVIVMLTDVETGVTAADRDVADTLRESDRPVVLAANKADNVTRQAMAVDFYELGLGEPLPVSAYHNEGVDDLMAEVVGLFPAPELGVEVEADVRIAIVGRTNVGKSMLLNALTGSRRAIVSDVPGTTRDAVDTALTVGERSFLLIDTAGIRRRGSIEPGIERFSVLRSIRAIDRADVAVLLLDASELATNQDAHVASYVLDAHKGMVLAVNKWDLAPELEMTREDAEAAVRARFAFASHTPLRFVSALRGTGAAELLDVSLEVQHRVDPDAAAVRAAPHGDGGDGQAPAGHHGPRRAEGLRRHPGRLRPSQLHLLREPLQRGPLRIPPLPGELDQAQVRLPGQPAQDALHRPGRAQSVGPPGLIRLARPARTGPRRPPPWPPSRTAARAGPG